MDAAPDVARADDDRDVDVELPRCGDDVFLIARTVGPWMPCSSGPANASPESFSRTRCQRAASVPRVFGSSSLIPS